MNTIRFNSSDPEVRLYRGARDRVFASYFAIIFLLGVRVHDVAVRKVLLYPNTRIAKRAQNCGFAWLPRVARLAAIHLLCSAICLLIPLEKGSACGNAHEAFKAPWRSGCK